MSAGTIQTGAGQCSFLGLASVGTLLFPHLLRELLQPGGRSTVDLLDEDGSLRQEQPAIFCSACTHLITTEDQRCEIAGSHRHTFFNPAGIVYELGCFTRAPGCGLVGEPSADFSWFAGHLWRIAVCARCAAHLGWRFQSADATFYGLILANLQSG